MFLVSGSVCCLYLNDSPGCLGLNQLPRNTEPSGSTTRLFSSRQKFKLFYFLQSPQITRWLVWTKEKSAFVLFIDRFIYFFYICIFIYLTRWLFFSLQSRATTPARTPPLAWSSWFGRSKRTPKSRDDLRPRGRPCFPHHWACRGGKKGVVRQQSLLSLQRERTREGKKERCHSVCRMWGYADPAVHLAQVISRWPGPAARSAGVSLGFYLFIYFLNQTSSR